MHPTIELAHQIAGRLGEIPGVQAVMLGGSWARGAAQSGSDLDLGLLYDPSAPPSIAALRKLARELDDSHGPDLVTEYGGWGPWINGGGWLTIQGQPIDWLYRDVAKLTRVIVECRAGHPAVHYQPGHPHGFHTHIYLGELYYAQPLYDPDGVAADLKAQVATYPPLMKRALIDTFLWEAGFALDTSRKSAQRGETFYVAGCLFRCAASLVQVLFALNEHYFMNEKGALNVVSTFVLRPPAFEETIASVLAHPGATSEELEQAVDRMDGLVASVRVLCAGST